MPPRIRLALLATIALVAVLPPAASSAAVMLPPVEGSVATAGERLTTGDGLELPVRRDGETLLVHGEADGFVASEQRTAGVIGGLAFRLNPVDRVMVHRFRARPGEPWVFYLNGAEWNPQPDTNYLLPNGGSIRMGANNAPPAELTTVRGDRVTIDPREGHPLRIEAASDRMDGELVGLLRFDAGRGTGDDLVDRDGAPVDASAALRSWSVPAEQSLFDKITDPGPALLGDGLGFLWSVDGAGETSVGDSVSGGALLRLTDRTAAAGDPTGRSREMGGREVVTPLRVEGPVVGGGPAVTAVRKTYVHRGERSFVRHLTVLRNRSDAPQRVTLLERHNSRSMEMWSSSSGDRLATPADGWAHMAPTAPPGPPFYDTGFLSAGVVWQDAGPRADSADAVFDLAEVAAPDDPTTVTPAPPAYDGAGQLGIAFGQVRLEPREQAAYLTATLADDGAPDGERRLAELAHAPDELFVGLSERERRSLRNWRPVGDRDGDGRDDLDDACPVTAAATGDGCPAAPAPTRPEPLRVEVPGPERIVIERPGAAPRVRPRAVTVTASRTAGRRARVTVRGRVVRPAGAPVAACDGFAVVSVRAAGARGALRRWLPVQRCRFSVSAALPTGWSRRALRVSARFAGSLALLPGSAVAVSVPVSRTVSRTAR